MAGNYWQSSHYQQWLLDRQDLLRERHNDLVILSEEGYQKIMIFYADFIQAIGEVLQVKQQVVATSLVYFKRFYVRNSLKCIDPLLLAPTCIFLASKVEEYGVISNHRVMAACSSTFKKFTYAWNMADFPYKINHVLECEFYLLEMMDCCLILYHPYRPLTQYVQDWRDKDIILPVAWHVINDSYRTDIPLLYPPHQIALACLHMACVITQQDTYKTWFAELNTDFDKILEITRHMKNLYELWKNFEPIREIPQLHNQMPKPNLLNSNSNTSNNNGHHHQQLQQSQQK